MTPACVGSTLTIVEPRTGGGLGQMSVNVAPVCRQRPRVTSGCAAFPLDDAPPERTDEMPRTPLAMGTSSLPALSRAR